MSKICLYLLPLFSTVKYSIDLCNIIPKNLRMLKAKINLYTGFRGKENEPVCYRFTFIFPGIFVDTELEWF